MRITTLFISLLFSFSALGNTIDLPGLGDSSATVLSKSEAQRLGLTAYRQLKAYDYVLEDLESNAYIQRLGKRLASGSDMPPNSFKFFIVKNTSINAFAMPGGFIGINAGLIMASDNESELAAVVAHEITHVTQHHIARVIEGTTPSNIATTALVIAAIILGGGDADITQAALSVGLAGQLERRVNFTREHEHEADRIGIKLLVGAGFDPYGMPNFFEKMYERSRYYSSELSEFLRTHPLNTTRITESQIRAETFRVPATLPKTDYAIIRERIRVLSAERATELVGLYESGQLAKDNDAARAYGLAVALASQGDYQQSITQLDALIEAQDKPHFRLARARASLAAKHSDDDILKEFDAASIRAPNNQAIKFERAQALQIMGKTQQARVQLLEVSKESPEHSETWRLLAQNSAQLGQTAQSHIYFAEYHLQRGKVKEAKQQLKTALTLDNLSEFEVLRLEARLQEIEKLLED